MQNREYVQTILNTLKAVAFHEIYMESLREDLCLEEFYDPLTAYKLMDAFKHNKVVGYEIYSFLKLYNFGASEQQCDEVIKSMNKKLNCLTYENFEELTLPLNISLRNKSLARYKSLKPEIGVMALVHSVKDTSGRKIAKFLMKQVEFNRELLLRKNQFCTKYGADLYTLGQILCKGKGKLFSSEQLIALGRQHRILFNKDEIRCIHRRIKEDDEELIETLNKQKEQQIMINYESFAHLLLSKTKELDVKNKIKIISGIAVDDIPKPSYQRPIFAREQSQRNMEEMNQKKKLIQSQRNGGFHHGLQFKYKYPEAYVEPNQYKRALRQENVRWREEVERMGKEEINIRYRLIDRKKYFY